MTAYQCGACDGDDDEHSQECLDAAPPEWAAHQRRNAGLRARYPGAAPYDTAAALNLLGSSHPAELAHAFLYPSLEAAEAYAASNAEHSNIPSLGIVGLPGGGWVGVLDLGPALAAAQRDHEARKQAS